MNSLTRLKELATREGCYNCGNRHVQGSRGCRTIDIIDNIADIKGKLFETHAIALALEAELREAMYFFRDILDQCPVGVRCTVDACRAARNFLARHPEVKS